MTDEQKGLALLLVLGAGVVVLMMRSGATAAAYAAPLSATAPCLPCQKKAQAAPMLARPMMAGATRYGNEERTEIKRDERGRIVEVIVHRDATVAPA
jgi:hypothetical protein